MSVNKDLNYAFALNHRCLWFLGVWPDPNVSVSEFRRINARFVIVTFILSFYVTIPQLTNMIRAWGNVGRMIEHVASANYSIMALSKLIVTWYHKETLRTIMMSVLADWKASKNNRERDKILKIVRSCRNLVFLCYIFSAITVAVYVFINLLRLRGNIKLQQQQRRLVYHFAYPYNYQKSPNYEITYLIQISGGVYTAVVNCAIDSFIATLLLHECAQLMNLRVTLNDLVNELANRSISSGKFKNRLAAIVMRHEHIIRNAKTIDSCYSIALFINMLAATFQLCFETFQAFTIITDHLDVSILKITFLLSYTVVILTLLYICCYSADKLLTESTRIAYGVYECRWYELSANDAKNLMFIVYRSTIPLRLTAGKFGIFSMEMFGTTVKTAMGYLSALLTMRN